MRQGEPNTISPAAGQPTPAHGAKEASDITRESLSLASTISRDDIRDRIDAALEKMRWQRLEVRCILLTERDRKELGRAIRRDLGGKGRVEVCGYGGHIVRTGKQNIIYSTHGVETYIPKRLSHRVAERAAA